MRTIRNQEEMFGYSSTNAFLDNVYNSLEDY